MSTLSDEIVKKIVYSIQLYTNAQSIPDLAEKLGYTKVALYKWIERGSLPVKKLTRMFPEFDPHYLNTGEGSLLKKKNPAKSDDFSPPVDAIAEINDEIGQYAAHLESLKKVQLPPDAALELLRSSIKLIQAYIDAVEVAQKGRDNS